MIYVYYNLGRSPDLNRRYCKHTESNRQAIHPPPSKPALVFFLSIFQIWVRNVIFIFIFFIEWVYILFVFVLGFWVFYQNVCFLNFRYLLLFCFLFFVSLRLLKLFPCSLLFCFVSATPYTQGQYSFVNFTVSNTKSVQFTKFGPLSFHLYFPLQNNRHREQKIKNCKPILPLQKLKRTLFFYQETIASLTI